MQTRDPQALERPVKAGRNYKECLTALRRFNYDLRVLVRELGATPDYLGMYQSLRDVPTNVLREDPLFASDLSAVLQDSGIELVQNQTNFTVYVEGLEKLFHVGSLKEDEKARKGYKGVVEVNQFTKDTKGPNAQKTKRVEAKKITAPPKPSQPTPDKGAKRKEQEGKDGQKKPEAEGLRPLRRNFITAQGCQFGRRCRYYHPNKAGKCRVRGAESHQAKDCTRPKEPNKEPEKSKERPKSKAKAGARATVQAEAGSASQSFR